MRTFFKFGAGLFVLILLSLSILQFNCLADDVFTKPPLYPAAYPYIKYFLDRALDTTSEFNGLTRSFQLYDGGQSPADEALIYYGAPAYDQSILLRLSLANGTTTILDTYAKHAKILSGLNPLLNHNGNYHDGNYRRIDFGSYRIVRILGRDIPDWWSTWDWIVDTGAAACLIIDASEGYQKLGNPDYKDLAKILGGYLLRLQDYDGGIRYGPIGMYHSQGTDFYWRLKSTEQNERCLYAFEALYSITQDEQYNQAANQIRNWLKEMYDKTAHLYHSAASFNGANWVKSDFGYVATDVTAFAPLELMFSDAYFGATQEARDKEVDFMFGAIEKKTAFLDTQGMPKLFSFSISQTGEYGSVEWSAQMAIAYLKVAQVYAQRPNMLKTEEYLLKYNALVNNLEYFFKTPSDDSGARVAPYASYLDGDVAGGVPTGTGYRTFNCQAALASAYYAFAKAGFDPSRVGGGPGIPNTYSTLNMNDLPWYQNTPPYNSSGAAVAQMIINYIRHGAVVPFSELSQNAIYEYAKGINPRTGDLTPVEVDKALGHFDPYDSLISNWSNSYDTLPDGNPLKGYNYSIDTYDPRLDAQALNNYLRDICHWMAYTVTKEDWWKDGALVAHPNTPAAIPIYGSYNHWVMVKGYAASANPCPFPRTDPFNTPDFTVYGFWIKDPLVNGLGKDTYKTAAECRSTYFLPVASSDAYSGMFLQVAEPPLRPSRAQAKIQKIKPDLANFEFIGTREKARAVQLAKSQNVRLLKKQSWKDIVDAHLLTDPQAVAAFENSKMGVPLRVKRPDKKYSDYYLVPFGKVDRKLGFLASGVVVIDAIGGQFKEASWSKVCEKFPGVEREEALKLIQKQYVKEFIELLKKRLKYPQDATVQSEYKLLRQEYAEFLQNMQYAHFERIWQPNELSSSPYKPYWKINVNWQTWYVTWEGKATRG